MSAADVVARLTAAGLTIATGESLTAGLVAARIADVPGASAVLRGGVVAYATEIKATVLGVDRVLLAERGAVDPEVAAQMAAGAARVLGADVGVATTGVAGPSEQDGQPVGTVFVAVSGALGEDVRPLALHGDRAQIRAATVEAVLDLVEDGLHGRG
ncbi:CinA family protein [Kribbia dieselivorans]|uniref:CinA family protein n=1 Tax=Kribbia dieselivorans TaxID=331526 RepID=UPI0008380295|nr:CinA family protein [Kribbia dieselivorans]